MSERVHPGSDDRPTLTFQRKRRSFLWLRGGGVPDGARVTNSGAVRVTNSGAVRVITSAEDVRITDDGDTRITDDGDTRITDG